LVQSWLKVGTSTSTKCGNPMHALMHTDIYILSIYISTSYITFSAKGVSLVVY
jgi:hypothetical protein